MSLSNICIDVFEYDIAKYFTYKDLAKMTSVSKTYNMKDIYQRRYPTFNKYIKSSKINIGMLIEESCFSQNSFHFVLERIERKRKLPINFFKDMEINLQSSESLSDKSVFSTFKIFKIFKLIENDIDSKKNAYALTMELARYFVQIFKYKQKQIGHYISDEFNIFKFVYQIMKSEKGKQWYMVSLNLYHIFENSILLKFDYLPVLQIDKLTNVEVEDVQDDDLQLMKSLDIILFIFFETEKDDVKMYLLMEILNIITKIKQTKLRVVSIQVLLSKIDQFIMSVEKNENVNEKFKTKFITYLNDFRNKNQI
jgi:hypothetical protein